MNAMQPTVGQRFMRTGYVVPATTPLIGACRPCTHMLLDPQTRLVDAVLVPWTASVAQALRGFEEGQQPVTVSGQVAQFSEAQPVTAGGQSQMPAVYVVDAVSHSTPLPPNAAVIVGPTSTFTLMVPSGGQSPH